MKLGSIGLERSLDTSHDLRELKPCRFPAAPTLIERLQGDGLSNAGKQAILIFGVFLFRGGSHLISAWVYIKGPLLLASDVLRELDAFLFRSCLSTPLQTALAHFGTKLLS